MKYSENLEIVSHLESCQSFSEILDYTSKTNPDKIFLVEGDSTWTYLEFNKTVNRCCRYFNELKLKPGDKISVVLRNSVEYLILYFSAIRNRLVINPFPFHVGAKEVLLKAEWIAPEMVFCHKTHYKELANSSYVIKNLDDLGEGDFVEFLKQFPDGSIVPIPIDEDQTAVLYYSSGTTGDPKVIEYTHQSMVAGQLSMVRSEFVKPNSVHLCVLPLGHTASLRYTIKQCICTGSTVVLYESFWKLRNNLWNEVRKHKANFMEIVPSILIAILNTPYKDFTVEQVESLDFIGCGSSFLPQNLQSEFEKKFKIPVANLYGLSETGATHFDNPLKFNRAPGSIGKPFDIIEVKIFDENKNEVPCGEVGEICMKGPSLLKGYYKNIQLYRESLYEGYFMTGDLGRVDTDGIYYYIERKKDLIIKGGVNIAPSQIDEVLLSNPNVEEVATIGVPDMLLGEVIKSFVVLKNGREGNKTELLSYCKKALGNFKTPSQIEFVTKLPKGPSGKILKKDLREKEIS
jgi:long-chain acyl-CoA synthetase